MQPQTGIKVLEEGLQFLHHAPIAHGFFNVETAGVGGPLRHSQDTWQGCFLTAAADQSRQEAEQGKTRPEATNGGHRGQRRRRLCSVASFS